MNTDNKNQKCNLLPVNIEFSVSYALKNKGLPVIDEEYYDENTHKLLNRFSLKHSVHSYKRARNRGITTEEILAVIEYGEVIFKQNMCFYIARKKFLPPTLDSHIVDKINNMVVVTNEEGDCLITCYKSKDSSVNLRKKTKQIL